MVRLGRSAAWLSPPAPAAGLLSSPGVQALTTSASSAAPRTNVRLVRMGPPPVVVTPCRRWATCGEAESLAADPDFDLREGDLAATPADLRRLDGHVRPPSQARRAGRALDPGEAQLGADRERRHDERGAEDPDLV